MVAVEHQGKVLFPSGEHSLTGDPSSKDRVAAKLVLECPTSEFNDTVEPVLKDHPIGHTKVVFGGRFNYIEMYVGPSARNIWSFKTGGLSWQWSLKTGFTVLIGAVKSMVGRDQF